LDFLRVDFHILVLFVFYEVISISCLQVLHVNLVDQSFFYVLFCNWFFFLILSFNILVDWKLSFIICFSLLYMRLSQSCDLSQRFGKLTRIFFCSFLIVIFFSITSFNIGLIRNLAIYIFLSIFYWVILVSWSRFGRLTQVVFYLF
jgi:hypothetical protein